MKRIVLLLLAASMALTSCNGLKKMQSNAGKVRYAANPNPIETMDEKVVVKFTG